MQKFIILISKMALWRVLVLIQVLSLSKQKRVLKRTLFFMQHSFGLVEVMGVEPMSIIKCYTYSTYLVEELLLPCRGASTTLQNQPKNTILCTRQNIKSLTDNRRQTLPYRY